MFNSRLSRYQRLFAICLSGFFLLQQTQVLASQVATTDLLNELDQSTPFFNAEQRISLRNDIMRKMQDAGVANDDLNQRIAALSDRDLQYLHTQFDQEAAGGDIIDAVIFVFLVLLITDIVGLTDVFPFVHHHHHRHPNKNRGHDRDFSPQP